MSEKDISPIGSLTIKCQKCQKLFYEKEIEASHDFPIYLCDGLHKKDRKQFADKKGRHYLCKECHDTYERTLLRRIYKLVLKENLVLNISDRRSLIVYQEKIKNFPIVKKWHCQKIVEEIKEEFYGNTKTTTR